MQNWDDVEETLRRCMRGLETSAQRAELALWSAHRIIAVQRDDSVVSTQILCNLIEIQSKMIRDTGHELVHAGE